MGDSKKDLKKIEQLSFGKGNGANLRIDRRFHITQKVGTIEKGYEIKDMQQWNEFIIVKSVFKGRIPKNNKEMIRNLLEKFKKCTSIINRFSERGEEVRREACWLRI